jgi:Tol biopolymer transport system component
MLVGGSVLFYGTASVTASADEAAADESPGSTDLITEAAGAQPAEQISSAAADPGDGSSNDSVNGTPELSPISFALKTSEHGEAIEPDFSFESGTPQIHAVFEYTNLSPDYIWTLVWYHNGSELLSNSQPWLDGDSGIFDYLIEADGQPLPAGDWAVELYMEGELLSAGSFVIESPDELAETSDNSNSADIAKLYKLLYPKWNGEKHDLYVGDTHGSQEQFIMSRAAGPSWSPDGRYIFFYGEEGVDQQIYNGNVHPLPGVSNGIIRLVAAPLPISIRQLRLFQGHGWNDGTARWASASPDGTMIAYDGDRSGTRRIYFLGTDANQQFRYEIIGEQASWSPDSQKIVYRSGRNNQFGIWISNRTDSGHTRLTDGGTDSFPTWSPDGQSIAFSRDSGGNVDIYTVEIDGTNLQRLTTAPGHDTLPLYLPNGDIAFRSARSGNWGIWKMKGDGTDQSEIIRNAPVGPEWSFSKMSVLR